MILYPAIDLRQGQCVRLYQGDYRRETVYPADPLSVARQFQAEGANWLHVVDLDGAKDPSQTQMALISRLILDSSLKVQVGGGIRSREQVQTCLDLGAARVIVGSLAVNDPDEVQSWFEIFGPEKIVLASDVWVDQNQEARVAINAWQKASTYLLDDLISRYKEVGLKHLLCTSIALDGTLNGPDLNLYKTLLCKYPFLQLQASGGISSLSDLKILDENGLAGAVIGRALYENQFRLKEALAC